MQIPLAGAGEASKLRPMSSYLSHLVGDEHFIMSAERALFWESESALIIADLHVGKTGHFRKEGIGVPQQVYREDLHRLLSQILFFKAEKLIIVGDLTHSTANKEMDLFRKWRLDFSSLEVTLVKGNHDILDDSWYADARIRVEHERYQAGRFLFVHEYPLTAPPDPSGLYTFSGHLHPGVSIHGRARQSLHFPCFYFMQHACILPAFSRFTGTYSVHPKKGEQVFALTGKDIVSFGKA